MVTTDLLSHSILVVSNTEKHFQQTYLSRNTVLVTLDNLYTSLETVIIRTIEEST